MKSFMLAKKGWLLVVLVLGAGVGVGAYGFSQVDGHTACPGQIVCPLTGENVCKDDCPLVDASRTDCPGKIECPLTGELVCRDRCPLGASELTANADAELPPCCRNRVSSATSRGN